jgi:cell division septal protein FtsQ
MPIKRDGGKMGKPVFKGENVISKPTKMRSYARVTTFKPTPPAEKEKMKVPNWFYKLMFSCLLIIAILWFFFASSFFAIKDIQIKGNIRPETRAVVEKLKGQNIFLIGKTKAENNLMKEEPGIKNIKILRGIPNTIIVELIERSPAITWVTQGKTYLVDKDGYVYREEIDNYTKVVDQKNIPVLIGQRITATSFVSFIEDLNKELNNKTGLDIDHVEIPETTYQIQVVTKNGPILKIDTSRSLEDQLSDIKYILDHNNSDSKNMIDVRVPGFAYIK